MNNLTINGIDYNAELNLLSGYMKDFVEDYFYYAVRPLQLGFIGDVESVIRAYKTQGILFYSPKEPVVATISYISFDAWKAHRRYPLTPNECYNPKQL